MVTMGKGTPIFVLGILVFVVVIIGAVIALYYATPAPAPNPDPAPDPAPDPDPILDTTPSEVNEDGVEADDPPTAGKTPEELRLEQIKDAYAMQNMIYGEKMLTTTPKCTSQNSSSCIPKRGFHNYPLFVGSVEKDKMVSVIETVTNVGSFTECADLCAQKRTCVVSQKIGRAHV